MKAIKSSTIILMAVIVMAIIPTTIAFPFNSSSTQVNSTTIGVVGATGSGGGYYARIIITPYQPVGNGSGGTYVAQVAPLPNSTPENVVNLPPLYVNETNASGGGGGGGGYIPPQTNQSPTYSMIGGGAEKKECLLERKMANGLISLWMWIPAIAIISYLGDRALGAGISKLTYFFTITSAIVLVMKALGMSLCFI